MAVTLFNALRTNFKFACNGALSRSLNFSSRDPVKQAVTCGNNNIMSLFSGSNPFGQFLKVCNGFNVISVRTAIRNHFPRPCERKRVLRHGWKKRMSTASGRRILMNRILKGRHVLSH